MSGSSTGSGRTPPGWRKAVGGNVLMVGLVSLLTDLSSELIYPLLPVFLAGLVPISLAPLYLGLMEGLSEAASSLVKVASGRLSDAIGRRKLLVVLGYGLSTAMRPVMAAAMAGWQVVGLRFVDRVGKGVRSSPRDALLGDAVPPQVRGLAFSFHRAMDHVGAVLGPLAGIAILHVFLGHGLWQGHEDPPTTAEMSALRWLFLISLLPGLAAMAVLVFGVREIAPRPEPAPGPDSAGSEDGAGRKWHRLPGRFYAYLGIVTLFALGNSSDLFLVFYGKTLFGLGLGELVGLWVALHLSKVTFSFPGGVLSDRLGRRPVIIAGWLVYVLVYVGLAFVAAQWQLWALIAAYGFYYGMTEGAEKALVADFVPSPQRGTGFGLYHGAVGVAALPASLLFGVFWCVLGPRLAFGIGAGLAGLAALLLFLLLAPVKARPSGPRGGSTRSPGR